MGSWLITLPCVAPSLNRALGAHWAARSRLQRDWFWVLRAAATHVPKAEGFRTVTITRYGHGRLDMDNLAGAHKFVVDLLRAPRVETLRAGRTRRRIGLGLIVDDSPDHVRVVYQQAPVPRSEPVRTEILIEDGGAP